MSKKLLSVVIFVFVIQLSFAAYAGIPYKTFSINKKGEIIYTQTGYVPIGIIDGFNIYEKDESTQKVYQTPLLQPEDIYIDKNDNIYVADTGNSRVVIFSKEGEFVKSIGRGILSSPTGVFVDMNLNIYVADPMNEKVYKFDKNGRLIKEYSRPDSVLYGEDTPFKPTKVVADKKGEIYIVSEGTYQGLVHLSSDGDFLGFFGGNKLGFDLLWYLKKIFYTKEQKSQIERRLPPSISNVAIDSEGLIYTCTAGLESEEIKKLNIAGNNLLPSKKYGIGFQLSSENVSSFVDITVDEIGNIYAVDAVNAKIFEYDKDGNVLFIFSGLDSGNQRLGLMKSPSGIAVSSDGRIYVLDRERNNIQIFKPTSFALLVHKAISLYLDGKYLQSEKPWLEILRQNSMFDLAHDGIGMVAMKKGDYKKALEEFRVSFNQKEYSNAYWEIRREWMLKYFGIVIMTLTLLILTLSILKKLDKRYKILWPLKKFVKKMKSKKLISDLLHSKRIMRHPIDGYWEIRREGKASVLSATIILILIIILRLFEIYQTNFIFTGVDIRNIKVLNEIYKVVLPLFAWVISNYLVSAINDGEGKFSQVYIGTIYALSPYLIFSLPITIISKFLTLIEISVYNFLHTGMFIWCGILLFFMVKEIHNYEISETLKNIIYTIIGMIIIAIIAFILFGLSNQVWDFVYSIVQEVKIRD